MNEKRFDVRQDLVRVVAAQVLRMDELYGRPDVSTYESFAKIKACLAKTDEAIKPIGKTVDSFWKEVVAADADLQASMLRELEIEVMGALGCMATLAATVSVARWSMDQGQERKIGQTSFDELEVDDDGE